MTRSAFLLLAVIVTAYPFIDSALALTIPTLPVGNPGNPADDTGFGSVDYHYRIGKNEVTNSQYVEFLNAVDPEGTNLLGLYTSYSASSATGGINYSSSAPVLSKYSVKPGRGNGPVAFIDWYDTLRFANWLHNGQGSGDTENGAYTILGGTPIPSNASTISRNAGARWWLPSEDEWYKAAYHKNDGATGNYWEYPTSSDTPPVSGAPPSSGDPNAFNSANFMNPNPTGNPLTDVGAYAFSTSPYGTYDQGGNVWEWNESLFDDDHRGQRGGVYFNELRWLSASHRSRDDAYIPDWGVGFRVATVPEASTILFLTSGIVFLGRFRRNCRPDC